VLVLILAAMAGYMSQSARGYAEVTKCGDLDDDCIAGKSKLEGCIRYVSW
jgi:hypothetical protein